jgi:hypothetical protein
MTTTRKIAPDTLALLRTGGGIVLFGFLCALLTWTAFGGVTAHGPTTNSGWLALIAFIMCTPFGLMLLVLGLAKWIAGRRN